MVAKIFENKKHVFWQAFFVTLLFFLLGLVLGVYLEQIRSDNFSITLSQSEISLYDSFALAQLSENGLVSCQDLIEANIEFADKIYEEARSLERFDEKSKLTESLKSTHKKYDLLRTLLWINAIEVKKKCGNPQSVVYLYIYDTEDVSIKSEQIVWERVLHDLKFERGNDIVLIPIAVDSGLVSLDALVNEFGVTRFPAVIVDEANVIYSVRSYEDIEQYL